VSIKELVLIDTDFDQVAAADCTLGSDSADESSAWPLSNIMDGSSGTQTNLCPGSQCSSSPSSSNRPVTLWATLAQGRALTKYTIDPNSWNSYCQAPKTWTVYCSPPPTPPEPPAPITVSFGSYSKEHNTTNGALVTDDSFLVGTSDFTFEADVKILSSAGSGAGGLIWGNDISGVGSGQW
jgi:hypothetical protein